MVIAIYEDSRECALKALGSAGSAPTSKKVWEQSAYFRPHHWSNQWSKNFENRHFSFKLLKPRADQ